MYPPAQFSVETPAKIANWRPLVQWLIAIPHFIVMYVLTIVGEVLSVVSWVIILITGKLPEGIANFQCMQLRYSTRTLAFAGFLHATNPPFEFVTSAADPGGHPARVDFAPTLEGRNRLTVGLRIIFAIPAMIITMLVGIVAYVCWIVGFFAVLFTGSWPAGLHGWVVKFLTFSTRLNAYMWLLTDEMPPLNFD